MYTLTEAAERRLSLKMLAHKVRRYLPCAYPLLLWLRYHSFARACPNPAVPQIAYSDGSWIARGPTADLKAITAQLHGQVAGLRLLQIGIGDSSLYAALGAQCQSFTGITIVEQEQAYATQHYGYPVLLMNKYGTATQGLSGPFDIVIDNDLSSYACCHLHFEQMLASYAALLAPQGRIFIGQQGLGYFDSGFGLTPAALARRAAPYGLSLQTTAASYILSKSGGGPGRT